ncbi:MAG: coenzyme F420 hydrogenase subunit gamma, partial [Methanomicrobiaceae archaeon]|nr:coenzyme F420 hydrogenase subunit gamma [Methanomicrobiaceae archaeon]
MGLLSRLKAIFTGSPQASDKKPGKVSGAAGTAASKPAKKPKDLKVEQKQHGKNKEEKPVVNKITVGHVHMS